MTPSSFSFFPMTSLLLSHLEELSSLSIQNARVPHSSDRPSFQFPPFSDEDRILLELEEAGICNSEGLATTSYETLSFVSLSMTNEEDRPTLEKIRQFLHQERQITGQLINENPLFHIPFSFFNLLTYLIHVSQHPSRYQKTSTSFAIDEIELIGRYLIELVGDYPFIKSCKVLFPTISHQRIDQWFSYPFIQDFFAQRASDIDIRKINQGMIDHQINLSQNAQIFFTDRMQDFHNETCCQSLKSCNEKKYGTLHPSSYLIRTYGLLEFGGVTKRKIVKNEENQYTILGLKTDERPFELISVGKADNDRQQTGLKNTCLSSSNCWTLSLMPFLNDKADNIQLSIHSGPFQTVQALIGLLTNSSFILDPSVDTWLRYLKDYSRSLQSEDIEHKMVCQLFENKTSYFKNQKKIDIQTISEISDSYYLACLLEDEMQKHHLKDEETIDPTKAVIILLRACLSIQHTYPCKDEEIAHLWQLLEKKGLLKLDSSDSSQSFHLAFKQALLDKKIPFSIASTWIGFLAHIFVPTSLTHHGHKDKQRTPVFCLKFPFSMRLPATAQAYDTLLLYLNEKGCDGFMQIFQSLEPFFESPLYPSPINDCLPYLNGNAQQLAKWGDVCLNHPEPFLQFIGAQLYLMTASYQLNQGQVYHLFYMLPSLLEGIPSSCSKSHFLSQLDQLASSCNMPACQQALNELDRNNPSLINWINALIATKDLKMIEMADFLWKNHSAFDEETPLKKESGLALLQAWNLLLPSKGLIHLNSLINQHLISTEQVLEAFLNSCKRFQDSRTKLNQAELIDFHTVLDYLLAHSLIIDEKESERRTEFSKFTLRLISMLYHIPSQLVLTDELLLKLSEQNLCHAAPLAETWLTRLEQQCNAPTPSIHMISVRFYELEKKGFLRGLDIKHPRLQEFKIKLGTLLIKEDTELSQKMLEELIKNDLNPICLPSLHEFLAAFLTKSFTEHLTIENISLLKHLIQITPVDKRRETSHLLQMVCQKAYTRPPSEIVSQLEALDTLLIASDLFHEMSGWRETLLNYVKKSATPDYLNRFPSLWLICGQARNLPGKKSDNLLLIQAVTSLLIQDPPPSIEMQNWLKERYITIVSYLNKQNDPAKASIFLKAVHRHKLIEDQPIFDESIWKTCQCYLSAEEVPLANILDLLQLASFENVKHFLKSSDLTDIQTFINHLLAKDEESLTMEAGRWIEACWLLSDQEADLKRNEENLILCLNRLITSPLDREILSWLQASLPFTSSQAIQSLWLRLTEKLQSKSSLKLLDELFLSQAGQHLFKDALSPLQELAKKEIENRLSSSLPAQNLQTILQFLSLYHFQDGKIWFEFSTHLLLSQDRKLIEDSFEAFKSEDDSLLDHPLIRARCWGNMFKSVYQTSPLGLLAYLDALPHLLPLFSPLPANEAKEVYRVVLLSAIASLSSKEFDQELFGKICSVKKEYITTFQTENDSQSETETSLHLWNFDLDCLLIQQLQTSKEAHCLEALCELIHPYLSHLDDKPEVYDRLIGSTEKIVKSYLALNLPIDHPLHSWIHSLLMQADYHKTFSTAACFRIVHNIKNQHVACLPYAIRLMHKIFTQGSLDQQLQLKQSFLTLLPAATATATRIELIAMSELLKSAFKIIKFSPKEKTLLCGHYLIHYLDRQLDRTVSIQELEDILKCYCDWAPHLFSDPKSLKEAIGKATLITLPFGSDTVTEFQDKTQFSLFVKNILHVKYDPSIKSQEAIYKESLKHYVIWCIQAWKQIQVRNDFLLEALDEFIYEEIIRASKREVPLETLLKELDEFIYFCPPEPPHATIPTEHSPIVPELPQERSRRLVNFAIAMKIFGKQSDKLVEYSIYLNLNVSYKTTDKVILQVAYQTIEKLLSFNTYYSIFLSTQAFGELQSLVNIPESKNLPNYIDKIGTACCNYPLVLINQHPLLYHLYTSIPRSYPPNTLSSEGKKYFSNIYLMQFMKIWNVYQEIEKTASLDFQAYYLKLALETLYNACIYHDNHKRWEKFIDPLAHMLPAIIRLDVFDIERKNDKLIVPQASELSSTLLDFLKIAIQSGDSLTIKDKTQLSSLLINWLNALMKVESKKEGRRACQLMSLALTDCLDSPIFHCTQPAAADCLNNILNWLPKYLADHEMTNIEYLQLRFFSHRSLNDYPSFLKDIEKLSTSMLTSEILTKTPGTIGLTINLITLLPSNPLQNTFELRSQALISFIDLLLNTLEEFEIDPFSEISNQLLSLLEIGIDQQILSEKNPEAVRAFEACCKWINPDLEHSFDPDLTLLCLEFYQHSRCSKDYIDYSQQLNSFIKPLKERIVQEQTTDLSDRFFKLLSKMPQPPSSLLKNPLIDQPGDLLAEWIKTLLDPFHTLSMWQNLRTHSMGLYENATHYPIFKNHLNKILLIINQSKVIHLSKTEKNSLLHLLK